MNKEEKENNLVTSVTDFMNKISKISKKHQSVFFRGHSDESFELIPSIYRKNDKTNDFLYIENEDKIYREIIAKAPTEFNNKKTIEALALMQHYGVPTRILDLTTNALIALYFACSENSGKKNGEVLVFDIPKQSICFSDSDRVTALSNLAMCGSDFYYKKELLTIYEEKIYLLENQIIKSNVISNNVPPERLNEYFSEILKVPDYVYSKQVEIKKYLSDIKFDFEETLNEKLEKWASEYSNNKEGFYTNELKNNFLNVIIEILHDLWLPNIISHLNQRYFGKLLHNIREDKSYFQSIINPNDIGSVFAVIPKMDNPRIIRQSGAFLLFGIKESPEFETPNNKQIKPMAVVPKKWIIRGHKNKKNRILIDRNSKNQILKELDMLGINESSIFPEIDVVAKYVKKKYSK